ncbi:MULTISPECIES: NUDIX hydrolase [unclassified Saccharopolyspora]|uniref:NUDIX hydrolase n=1 Tax=unclassified Saccharopolyspora TaxID=2646250 RepID=UPI001CD6A0E5|nr:MULTISPECIES: NUDIX domain-containing protein [unclassified Saccharopolyspora]MCA1188710.1 NUDIX domain-containing protein [Saccharopolyspora sp. 6T]MCA1227697.1 NUDIX domain-containing protein [Saccharopolyspora sp. 6M]MCA1279225.1 NUDIX domain-containing protein [Saccharopolyspora sp. 7B]
MGAEVLHADAEQVLRGWRPSDYGQEALRHAFLALLDAREDACLRACAPGHVTASAVLLDAAGEHVLLTLHPRVGKWLQLGGHCEPEDTSLAGAALREATEESGIDGLAVSAEPVHLDVHPITCSLGVPTRHFDVRYLVRAPAGAEPVRSDESLDLRWWPIDALPAESDLGPLLAAARPHPVQSTR